MRMIQRLFNYQDQKVIFCYLEREIFIVEVQGIGEVNYIMGKVEDRCCSNKDYKRLSKIVIVGGFLGKFSNKIEI